MKDEIVFDYRRYIEGRLREIDDLDERRYARKILVDGLANIFDLSEQRYRRLEERLSEELEVPWNKYEIVTTVTELNRYDPIHETLFPVCPEDAAVGKNKVSEAQGVITVYLAAEDGICQEFLEEGKIAGTIAGRKVSYKISRSRKYQEAVEKIYRLFQVNQIPWQTIHRGYLERFFDLEPLEEAENTGDDPTFQGGKWEPYIRCHMIPLWNIRESMLRNRRFALPCLDGICYEHSFNVAENGGGTFLVDTAEDLIEIRQEQSKVVIKTKSEKIKEVSAYQICSVTGLSMLSPDYLPLLTNRREDSFIARYLHKTGRFLQTEAELSRKVTEMSGDYGISLVKYEIREKAAALLLHADMNDFIREEVFPREKRRLLLLYFEIAERDYLSQAHIRYILSQIQLEFIEYQCVGLL